jgi:hypothetical protein
VLLKNREGVCSHLSVLHRFPSSNLSPSLQTSFPTKKNEKKNWFLKRISKQELCRFSSIAISSVSLSLSLSLSNDFLPSPLFVRSNSLFHGNAQHCTFWFSCPTLPHSLSLLTLNTCPKGMVVTRLTLKVLLCCDTHPPTYVHIYIYIYAHTHVYMYIYKCFDPPYTP